MSSNRNAADTGGPDDQQQQQQEQQQRSNNNNNNSNNNINNNNINNNNQQQKPQHHQHKAPEQTSHMTVLGRDGNDFAAAAAQQQGKEKGTGTGTNSSSSLSSPAVSPPQSSFLGPSPNRPVVVVVKSSQSQTNAATTKTAPRTATTTTTAGTNNAKSNSLWNRMQSWTTTGTSLEDNDDTENNYQSLDTSRTGQEKDIDNNDDDTNKYQSLGPQPPTVEPPLRPSQKVPSRKRRNAKQTYHAVNRDDGQNDEIDVLRSPTTSTTNHTSSAAGTTTTEEKVRQECSFFYRGLEDETAPPSASTTITTSPATRSALYNAAPRLLSARDGAAYHAKYQRLNQEIINGMNDYDYDDLELAIVQDSNDDTVRSDCSRNVINVQNSSLFYEQNGRLLLKLPRDQVRLVMDTDLEAGIVSVEQWRKEEPISLPPISQPEITTMNATTTTTNSMNPLSDMPPPLSYVLTVPDDLYRRVVSEMNDKLTAPYCGIFKCCDESEHADIRIAIVIMLIVLLLLFISTLEWPTE